MRGINGTFRTVTRADPHGEIVIQAENSSLLRPHLCFVMDNRISVLLFSSYRYKI